ncbi:MAG: hypothetical protein R6V59_08200 [Dehalococcoidia bacterium]
MKNRILFVSLAVVLAVGLGLAGCNGGGPVEPEAPESIVVGLARDINEGMEVFECYHAGPLYRFFVDEVNAEGGIYLSEYDESVPLELVVRDFSVATWDVGTVVQGLIDDGADVIWGGPSTDTIYTLAPVCNANAVNLIALEGGAAKMVSESEDYLDNWPYVWCTLSFANWYEIPVLKGIMDDVAGGTPKAYVTYIGGLGAEHGLEYRDETVTQFGGANVLPGGTGVEHTFMMEQGEADTIIQNAMTALNTTPYDVFCAYTYPWNVAALFIAAQTYDFNPPAIVFGPGSSQGYFSAQWGNSTVEGIMSFTMANEETEVQVGTPTMTMADLYAGVAAQIEEDWTDYDVCPQPGYATSGSQMLDFWGQPCFMAGLEMWKAAVEEVGDLDNTAIRNVLASYNATNPAPTCFGDTWFEVFGGGLGGGVLSYKCHTGEIGQWQSGIFETLGYPGVNDEIPNHDTTAPTLFPMTDQWAWLSD